MNYRRYTPEEREQASEVDLYSYLKKNYSDSFDDIGLGYLTYKTNPSLQIRKGKSNYFDSRLRQSESGITFLHEYLGFSIKDAVIELANCKYRKGYEPDTKEIRVNIFYPDKAKGKYRQLFAKQYKLGISPETTQMLIDRNLLYQGECLNRMVFINKDKDYYEVRETLSGKSQNTTAITSRVDGFWSFTPGSDNVKKALVCNDAIEALYLYEIRKIEGDECSWEYISIAGDQKMQAIERIRKEFDEVVMTTDCHDASTKGLDLKFIHPNSCNWNEHLRNILWEEQNLSSISEKEL